MKTLSPVLMKGCDQREALGSELVVLPMKLSSSSGFGASGPYARRGGFDLVAQGMSGIMSVTGEVGRPPVKLLFGYRR